MADYDFGGWASKYNVPCTDGTTIREGCFSDQNGVQVPLMWMHNHNDIVSVLVMQFLKQDQKALMHGESLMTVQQVSRLSD